MIAFKVQHNLAQNYETNEQGKSGNVKTDRHSEWNRKRDVYSKEKIKAGRFTNQKYECIAKFKIEK